MRPLARTFVVAILVLLPVTAAAQTLTIRDLVALNQAGLGDEVLVALIEADGSIFRLSPLDVLELKKQGLSDPLLIKMIQTVKPTPVQPPPAPPRDNHARDDVHDPLPSARSAAPPPPVVVQQTVVQEVHVEAPRQPREREYVQVPVYVPVAVQPRRPVKEPEPVYWGFGGQRRPDSWVPEKTTPEKPKPAGGGGRF